MSWKPPRRCRRVVTRHLLRRNYCCVSEVFRVGTGPGLCEVSAGDDAKKTAEIVPDCRQDDRFKDSKLVHREAGIRLYVAVPMLSNASAQTGSLVVWGDVARQDIGDAEMAGGVSSRLLVSSASVCLTCN